MCRSLWGERGLKSWDSAYNHVRLFVAPCEGNVDWNVNNLVQKISCIVAPCEGSVDWNIVPRIFKIKKVRSLPVRGAWIEISSTLAIPSGKSVAPCEGSVDWNWYAWFSRSCISVAPCEGSVDWNTLSMGRIHHGKRVAPCEGSVDWNMRMAFGGKVEFCRSLWGERGLKSLDMWSRTWISRCRSLWGERGLKFFKVIW